MSPLLERCRVLTSLILLVGTGWFASCAPSHATNPGARDGAGSALTSVSVSLPNKAALAPDVAAQLTGWKLSVAVATPDGQTGCNGGTLDFERTGIYEPTQTIAESLRKGCHFKLTLSVGSLEQGGTLPLGNVRYSGSKLITPSDMEGFEQLGVAITLKKVDGTTGPGTLDRWTTARITLPAGGQLGNEVWFSYSAEPRPSTIGDCSSGTGGGGGYIPLPIVIELPLNQLCSYVITLDVSPSIGGKYRGVREIEPSELAGLPEVNLQMTLTAVGSGDDDVDVDITAVLEP